MDGICSVHESRERCKLIFGPITSEIDASSTKTKMGYRCDILKSFISVVLSPDCQRKEYQN